MHTTALEVRTAAEVEARAVHDVLSESFDPFKGLYTEEAYNITIMTPAHIKERIQDDEHDVLVAYLDDRLVGTVTLQYRGDDVYVRSMGVRPAEQHKGVGKRLLETIEERARHRGCKTITLECFEPLKRATTIYEKAQFKITGKKRRYYGIETFEMVKELHHT